MRLLAGARGSAEVIVAVHDYLATRTAQQVADLQRLDGGWAPFDDRQRPVPVFRPTDVLMAREAVRSQCAALRSAGVTPGTGLVELRRILSLACRKLVLIERHPA